MIAKLIDPVVDKNYSIQFFEISQEERQTVLHCFHTACAKWRGLFLQGDSGGWMMIEFWTNDVDVIITVCNYFQKTLNITIEGL